MDNRVYYGEYSLEHWINLILKRNIILPPYQRYFVWNEGDVEKLIETLREKQFVPPVTIGAYEQGGETLNLILDGQQRLTSILLAYLGRYPDAEAYKEAIELLADDNVPLEDAEEEEDQHLFDNILKWQFTYLTDIGKNKQAILQGIEMNHYKALEFEIDDAFFQNTFLGFSYLVPQVSSEGAQQRYYSSVFRNINVQGVALLPQESRQALYFLDNDLVGFFSPDFCEQIVIKLLSSEAKADFVRYLSMLAQYNKTGNVNMVARGYKPKMEKFYENYINASINDITSEIFGKFSEIIPNKDYHDLLEKVKQTLILLEIPGKYPSIIDLDIYLFGLIYHIIFQKASIDEDEKEALKQQLNAEIEASKNNGSHRRSPNNLGHLRHRISQSIHIYGQHLS